MASQVPASTDDKVQIQELVARYAWSFDTGDVEGFVGCFAKDATLCEDVFDEVDQWEGLDQIRSMAEHFFAHPGFPGRQHHASQLLIEGSTERCRVRAFCFVIEPRPDQPCLVVFSGYYDDVAVKVDGQWLFQERVIRHWSGPVLANFPGQDGVKVPRKRPPG
ncbi:MAG: snoaL-like domain protein [Alphaproteobacteria bacterium]|nr:snoaL-like domain protein [Alphaproteobacteria bacterium]